MNNNTKYGISSPELSNLLLRGPQFHKVKRLRRQSSNEMDTYWIIGEKGKKSDLLKELIKVEDTPGWVEVPPEAP